MTRNRIARFPRLVIAGGLPVGALVGLATEVRAAVSWLDVAITAVVSAALIGTALALVAHGFVTRVRRRPITIVLFLLVMTSVGGLVAGTVYLGAARLPHGRWVPLAMPPEPLAELGGPDCYYQRGATLYARARSGRLYSLPSSHDRTAWVRADRIPSRSDDRYRECREPSTLPALLSPRPPGRVVASHEVRLDGVDCGGGERYVLLDDGDVWRWSAYSCAIGEVVVFGLFLLIAIAWSLAVALFIVVRQPPFGWPRTAPEESAP